MNQEILDRQAVLEKAIQKAHDNGFKGTVDMVHSYQAYGLDDPLTLLGTLVMQKGFVKALWGEEEVELWFDDGDLCQEDQPLLGGLISYPYNEGAAVGFKTKNWQYHLQQMVIADDPIAYLGENI